MDGEVICWHKKHFSKCRVEKKINSLINLYWKFHRSISWDDKPAPWSQRRTVYSFLKDWLLQMLLMSSFLNTYVVQIKEKEQINISVEVKIVEKCFIPFYCFWNLNSKLSFSYSLLYQDERAQKTFFLFSHSLLELGKGFDYISFKEIHHEETIICLYE